MFNSTTACRGTKKVASNFASNTPCFPGSIRELHLFGDIRDNLFPSNKQRDPLVKRFLSQVKFDLDFLPFVCSEAQFRKLHARVISRPNRMRFLAISDDQLVPFGSEVWRKLSPQEINKSLNIELVQSVLVDPR